MPRLCQLRYFVAVAEEGQMTAAAQKLHLPQPALSQAIAQLERQLGVDPLRRNDLDVTLTPAGELILTKERAAIEASDDAALAAHSLAHAGRGALRVRRDSAEREGSGAVCSLPREPCWICDRIS